MASLLYCIIVFMKDGNINFYKVFAKLTCDATKMETTASFLTQSYRLIFLTVAGLLLASCAAPQPPTETPRAPVISAPPVTEETPDVAPRQRINIGLLLPLSGPQASLGKTLLQAAILALHDSDDQRLHLLPEDTRGDPTVAESALQRLLEKKADIIIGPLFAHNTQRITPLAQQANIPVLSLSSDYKVAAPGIYLMGFRPEEQVSHILQYAATHGFDQYAVLLPETSYGQRILATIGAQIAQLEKTLSAISFYPPDTNQLFEPVKNLADYDHRRQEYVDEITFLDNLGENDDFAIELKKEIEHKDTLNPVDFDAVLLPEGGALLRTLAPMLSYYDVDTDQVKLLGTGLWDDPLLMKEPQLGDVDVCRLAGVPARRGCARSQQTSHSCDRRLPPSRPARAP